MVGNMHTGELIKRQNKCTKLQFCDMLTATCGKWRKA